MPSSRHRANARRRMFLKLSQLIEGQLRDAYAEKHELSALTQADLARKLNVGRSAIHRRLSGASNMTIETIADMIWALEKDVEFRLVEPVHYERAFAPEAQPLLQFAEALLQLPAAPPPAPSPPQHFSGNTLSNALQTVLEGA